jgi:predicted O-linked N-acetylglucosamine transferase (SPINDLY family)
MRLTWAAATLVLLSAPAFASTDTQLASCAAISDKLDRLICYDNLAASATSASSSVSASASKSNASVVATTNSNETFGLKKAVVKKEDFGLIKKADVEEIEKLYFTVAELNKDAYGSLTITLNNDQVWKQSGSQRYKLKTGQKIFIERAALGSFLLGSDDRNATIRVKRLK